VDYQQAAVPVLGTSAWQPRLARLRTVAVGVLNSHVNDHGRCAACGSDWPCGRAVLAENNLAMCNDTDVLRPPETASRRRPCRSRSHTRNGLVGRQRTFWPVEQPRQTNDGAPGGDMTMQWPLRNTLQLGALPTAAPCARLHAKHLLWEWRLEAIADTAELLVSELVTNGVNAAQAMKQKPPVWLRLSTDNIQLLIEVWDGNTWPSNPQELQDGLPSLEDEGGRGLFLVAALSDHWNWYLTQEPIGKVVWCELHVQRSSTTEDSESASHTLLPRRFTHVHQVAPAKAMDDPFTLRRVRDGLRELDHATPVIPAHTEACDEIIPPMCTHPSPLRSITCNA
jgi:anti-sigma regulatory factor (Ser/Thr protein kinase)